MAFAFSRSHLARTFAVGSLGFGCAVACQDKTTDRPNYDDGGCLTECTGSGSGSTPDGGTAGNQGLGGASTATDTTGKLVAYTGLDFQLTQDFTLAATVAGQAPGALTWVQTDYDTTQNAFELPGVAKADGVWFLATPGEVQQNYPTFSQQDSRKSPLEVPVVPASLIEQVYANALQDDPKASDAQILVLITDSSSKGVANVTVTVQGAEFTAYEDAGQWLTTLQTPKTTSSGLAFVGNVPAQKLPAGGKIRVTYSGAISRDFYVYGAAGAVTVLREITTP